MLHPIELVNLSQQYQPEILDLAVVNEHVAVPGINQMLAKLQ